MAERARKIRTWSELLEDVNAGWADLRCYCCRKGKSYGMYWTSVGGQVGNPFQE